MGKGIIRKNDLSIDLLEWAISNTGCTTGFSIVHTFTPGLYSRTILMPKGSILTSKIHKTVHQFCIPQGKLKVFTDGKDVEDIAAPYLGTTLVGTRRVLQIYEDTIWTTFHPLPFITGDEGELPPEEIESVVKKIEDVLLEKYTNDLLGKSEDEVNNFLKCK